MVQIKIASLTHEGAREIWGVGLYSPVKRAKVYMSIKKRVLKNLWRDLLQVVARVVVYVTITGTLRIQPWSHDRRRNQTGNKVGTKSRKSRQKEGNKKSSQEGHCRQEGTHKRRTKQGTHTQAKSEVTNRRQPHK